MLSPEIELTPRRVGVNECRWDVMLLEGDERLISRRCGTEHARYCADVIRQDTMHHGWVEG